MPSVRSVVVIAYLLASTAGVRADPQHTPPAHGDDPIGDRLFSPELIMSHQKDIGLDDKVRGQCIDEIQHFQDAAVKIQWDLKAAGEELSRLLSATTVDDSKALAQVDKVMALEHDLKRAHLALLIHLKNRLTAQQQAKLAALRAAQSSP